MAASRCRREKAFLEKISPYSNIRRGGTYPEPYIWTTTKDDRVGPQHARKFAARMKEYGLPYLFYEDTEGGHSGDADIAQGARLQALQTTYFAQKLYRAGQIERGRAPRSYSLVIPAKAGTQEHKPIRESPCSWVPAFAGMTV